jgi:8-oxo-dGTP diphosphatase
VTVDVVLLHAPPGAPHPFAFLHRRAKSPYMGCWALPGAFLRMEDDLEQAARRVMADEIGVEDPALRLEQLGAFGAPSRDPRTRVVTIAYLVVATARPETRTPPEQADALAWFEVFPDGRLKAECGTEPAETAFDHGEVLAAALRRLRSRDGSVGSGPVTHQ